MRALTASMILASMFSSSGLSRESHGVKGGQGAAGLIRTTMRSSDNRPLSPGPYTYRYITQRVHKPTPTHVIITKATVAAVSASTAG